MSKNYESPALRELGSLTELTEQSLNKVGSTPDIISQAVPGGVVVGSFVPGP